MFVDIKVCSNRCIKSSKTNLGTTGEHNATVLRFSFFEELNGNFVSDFQKYLVVLFEEGEKSYPIGQDNKFEIPSELTESPELLIRVDLKKDKDVIFKSEPKLFTFADSDIVPPSVQKKHPLIGDIDKLKTKNKENLVEAINEIYENGGGQGGGIDESVLEGYVKKSEMPKINVDDVVEKLSGTVNVYEPITEGWVANASIAPTTGEITVSDVLYKNKILTPPIPVAQNTVYSFSGQVNNSMVFCYKENGDFIGYALLTTELADTVYHYGQMLPLTAYIRFGFDTDTDIETTVTAFNSSFMLCKGQGVPPEYVGFDEGGYQFKENVYLSESRITEIAEKAVEIIDTALLPIIGSGVVE